MVKSKKEKLNQRIDINKSWIFSLKAVLILILFIALGCLVLFFLDRENGLLLFAGISAMVIASFYCLLMLFLAVRTRMAQKYVKQYLVKE